MLTEVLKQLADSTRKYVLQDLVRLLQILFSYGSSSRIHQLFERRRHSVPVEDYLLLLPQLTASMYRRQLM